MHVIRSVYVLRCVARRAVQYGYVYAHAA
jgi:hypothetical protein